MQNDVLLAIQEATGLNVAPADVFVGQFVLNHQPIAPIDGYLTCAVADRWLHYCPTLDLCRLKDAAGQTVACLLGIALDDAGQYLSGDFTLNVLAATNAELAVEELLVSLTGRYVVVSRAGPGLCMYTDAVGEMGVVYDTQTGIAGSTLPMILSRAIIDRDDIDHQAVMDSRGHYALGYTRDSFCERLLPNHRLDLHSLSQTRFWPRDDTDWARASELAFDDMIDELLAILRRNTIGFLTAKPSVFPLSGGQDSRILASSARNHLVHASALFGMEHNWISIADCDVGAEVAKRLGFDYWRIKAKPLRKCGRRAFHTLVGYAVNSGGIRSWPHANMLPQGHLVIRGNVMGLTRASDWGRYVSASRWDNTRFGIGRLLMGDAIGSGQRPSDLEDRYIAWRDSLPGCVQYRSHDLSFCENYLPNSLGARNYAYTNVTHVNPFASRRTIMIVSAVDPQLRKNNRINDRLLSITAPDLADIRLV